jgi:hypothetical protein
MTVSEPAVIDHNISDRQRINGHQKIQGVTTAIQHAAEPRSRGRPTKFTPERMQQITNLVERGKTREEIAEIIGVTTGTLQVTCSKLGISLRRPRFDTGTGLLQLRRPPSHRSAFPNQLNSHRASMMTAPVNGYQAVSEAGPTEEAADLTIPHRDARPERSNGHALAHFAIRMAYKGEERSTSLPLDQEMIRQLAMEAEFRGMRMGELVAALILAITRKDLFQLVLTNAPEQLPVGVSADSSDVSKD